MQKQIQSFINDLKSNKRLSSFDEASTKQAVNFKTTLSLLGWDIFNVEEVYPDYAVIYCTPWPTYCGLAVKIKIFILRLRKSVKS